MKDTTREKIGEIILGIVGVIFWLSFLYALGL